MSPSAPLCSASKGRHMTPKYLLPTIVFGSLTALACEAPEKLEGPWITPIQPMPKASATDTEAIAVWHKKTSVFGGSEVHAARYQTGGAGWSGPINLGSGGFPTVALSSASRGLVVFLSDGLTARRFNNGVWGPATTVSTEGANLRNYDVAVDGAGNGVVAWTNDLGTQVRAYSWGSGWDPTVSLSSSAGAWPRVASNEAGDTVAAWCQGTNLKGARRPSGSTEWTKTTLAADCCTSSLATINAHPVRIGVSANGDAIVIATDESTRVCAVRYAAGVGWKEPVTLAATDARFPAIALNDSGNALAAWVRSGNDRLVMRAFTPGEGWGPAMLGPTDVHMQGIGVGISASGNGAAVLTLTADLSTPSTSVYHVGYNASTGELTPPSAVESLDGSSYYLSVTSTPSGRGLSIWNQSAGGAAIWVSRYGF